MGSRTPRLRQIGHDAVALAQRQAPHARLRHVDAVAGGVDEVSVAVGMHREQSRFGPLEHPFAAVTGRRLAPVDEDQQQVGEVHHQTDRHGDRQIEHRSGVSRMRFHRSSSPYHDA